MIRPPFRDLQVFICFYPPNSIEGGGNPAVWVNDVSSSDVCRGSNLSSLRVFGLALLVFAFWLLLSVFSHTDGHVCSQGGSKNQPQFIECSLLIRSFVFGWFLFWTLLNLMHNNRQSNIAEEKNDLDIGHSAWGEWRDKVKIDWIMILINGIIFTGTGISTNAVNNWSPFSQKNRHF